MENGYERIANFVDVAMVFYTVCLNKYKTVVRRNWKIAHLNLPLDAQFELSLMNTLHSAGISNLTVVFITFIIISLSSTLSI